MLRLEASLVLLSLLIAFVYPSLGSRWFEKMERRFSQLSRRRVLSVVLIGVSALALRVALLPILPIPEPISHDEWGHLLAADTFAHRRLTNPTHPMWIHFESFSILQKPTYQTYMAPAQGMILAVGKVVFGNPFWGVWLSCGVMCAAITWMLQAWIPARWALLGGMLSILRYGVFGYWANSYWGGAMGAIGGALVLGALPRIKREQRVRDALLMGLGLTILANSRPYEGFIFSLPIAFALCFWMLGKQRPPIRVSFHRAVLPLFLVLIVSAVAMSYYFWRVTGNPFLMPYHFQQEAYVARYMIWQSPKPAPVYHHYVFWKMCVQQMPQMYAIARSPAGLLIKTLWMWPFFLGPAFSFVLFIAIAILPYGFSWREISKNVRFLLILSGTFVVGLGLETFFFAHYAAPATAIILALVLQAMRRIQLWRHRGRPTGLFLTRAIPVICAIMFVLRATAGPLHIPIREYFQFAWHQKALKSFGRETIQNRLLQIPGNHLIIVRYRREHEPFAEWVYNDADIDHAKIVWAREMDPAENRQLLDYFRDRQAWLLEADEVPPKLTRYPQPTTLQNKDLIGVSGGG